MKKSEKSVKKAIISGLCGVFLGCTASAAWETYDTEVICDATSDDFVRLYTQRKSSPSTTELLVVASKDQLTTGQIGEGTRTATVALNTAASLLENAHMIGILEISNLDQPNKEKAQCQLIYSQKNEWINGLERVIGSTISRFP